LASALGGLSAPSQAAPIFIDHTDELNVTGPFSSAEETHRFYGNSVITLEAEHQAISEDSGSHNETGQVQLYDNSILNASVSNAIIGGSSSFLDQSFLNLGAENAMSGTAIVFLKNNATINALALNAISSGSIYASENTTLNVAAANAISGGYHFLSDHAVLNTYGAKCHKRRSTHLLRQCYA
jgi:beta-N-acetylglucosaminidase